MKHWPFSDFKIDRHQVHPSRSLLASTKIDRTEVHTYPIAYGLINIAREIGAFRSFTIAIARVLRNRHSGKVRIAWALKTKHKNWPERFQTTPSDVPREPVLHGIRVLWIGHAGVLIQTPSLNIIADPILFDAIDPRLFPTQMVTHPGVRLESLEAIHQQFWWVLAWARF